MQEKNILLRKIENAFIDVPHPGGDNIFVRLDVDDVDFDDLDYDAFRVLHWKNLTMEFFMKIEIRAMFSYFTIQALKFYLPGIMNVIVNNPQETEENGLRDALVCAMTPVAETADDKGFSYIVNYYRNEMINSFSQKQLAVFRSFLEFMNRYYPRPIIEGYALERYWGYGKTGEK